MKFLRKRRTGYLMNRLEKRKPTILLIVFIIVLILWYIDYSTSPFVTPSFVLLKEEDDEFLDEVYELPENDYNKLINISFEFSMVNLVCKKSYPIFLLVLVTSAPENFYLRKLIRDTWGKQEYDLKIVFMLGSVKSDKLQKTLEWENKQYKDLVQGSFLDVYRNLTYKHVMGLKYFVYYCPKAKYVLKTDDDIYVNIPAFKNLVYFYLSPHGVRRGLFCVINEHNNVVRNSPKWPKWHVSPDEYSDNSFPTFCSGSFILYSPDVALALYKEAQLGLIFLHLEDVYATGILRQRLNISITQIGRLDLNTRRKNMVFNYPRFYYLIEKPFIFSKHGFEVKELRKLHKFVLNHPPPRYIYYV